MHATKKELIRLVSELGDMKLYRRLDQGWYAICPVCGAEIRTGISILCIEDPIEYHLNKHTTADLKGILIQKALW